MIRLVSGDIFAAKVDALVIPVNCVGVMGKGLALQARQRFPIQCRTYFAACRSRALVPGGIAVSPEQEPGMPALVFAATKGHWENPSKLLWVQECADEISSLAFETFESFAVPALGCGLGGLDWEDVRGLLIERFTPAPAEFRLYEPT